VSGNTLWIEIKNIINSTATNNLVWSARNQVTTTGAALTNSHKFTAREDDGTGLYYYRARYYHPALGRFLTEDPMEYGGGGDVNQYGYVGNRPTEYRDPSGSQAEGLALFEFLLRLAEQGSHYELHFPEGEGPRKWVLSGPPGQYARPGKDVDMGQTPVASGGACSTGDHRWWRAQQGTDYNVRQGQNSISRTEFVWWFEMDTIGIFSVNRARCVCRKWVVTQDALPGRITIKYERWEFDYVLGPLS
jgi:RHS repeat-associated protein